jgi:sorbitol/mannitol transport system substrate-binding protein
MEWRPKLDSEAWASTIRDYVSLMRDYGPSDGSSNGYSENLELFQNGECAIWVDATAAASSITDPDESRVADRVGFALAPDHGLGKRSNWLWAWALAISEASTQKDAAKRFVAWATSKEYIELVAGKDSWANVPPGTRKSLYSNPAYLRDAPFAAMTLASIETADPESPTVDKVPYTGIQYVAIPEFPGIGTAVGTQIAEALEGEIDPTKALENAQWVTGKVIERARFVRGN